MKRTIVSEKGFMFPLASVFLFFMSLLLLISSQQYVAEKRFLKETETIRLQEYYLLCSLMDTESLIRNGDFSGGTTLQYLKGAVTCQRQEISAEKDQITFRLLLNSGERREATAVYDKVEARMVKWTEK